MVEPLGHGRYRVDGRLAFAVTHGTRTWVFVDGRTYVVEAAPGTAARRGRAADEQIALAAPMPATVIAINVAPGQSVLDGDVLITLEAMKMELPIKAPRDGRIKAIGCQVGELVQPGVPLVEFESQ